VLQGEGVPVVFAGELPARQPCFLNAEAAIAKYSSSLRSRRERAAAP
jgi:hypothetical protein